MFLDRLPLEPEKEPLSGGVVDDGTPFVEVSDGA